MMAELLQQFTYDGHMIAKGKRIDIHKEQTAAQDRNAVYVFLPKSKM